jgi:hypothetical protein
MKTVTDFRIVSKEGLRAAGRDRELIVSGGLPIARFVPPEGEFAVEWQLTTLRRVTVGQLRDLDGAVLICVHPGGTPDGLPLVAIEPMNEGDDGRSDDLGGRAGTGGA